MICTYHFGVVTQFDNIYYVSKNGDDANLGKNIEESLLTISYAISLASSTDLIVVLPGVYNENLNITSSCNLVGYDNLLVEIVGKTTINHSLDIVNIKNIFFNNINDNVFDIQCSSDTAEIYLKDCNIFSTWNVGTGQTVNTAKSTVKISRGVLDINSGRVGIEASNDNTNEHNTAAFWSTGNQKIEISCLGVLQSVINSTDDYQNLESIFNNNTNADTNFNFKNGKIIVEGKFATTNYLTVFYNFNTSNTGDMIVEGNMIILKNSSFAYTAFNFNSHNHVVFSNNGVFPINISNIYIANEYSGNGSIDVKDCYFDTNNVPLVNGDVDYTISFKNGRFLTSDRLGINTTDPNYPLDVVGTTRTSGLIIDGSIEITSISTGTTDNDKLVTKGYVDTETICKYASDNSLSTTSSTTFVQKLRLSTGTIPTGVYQVSWSYQWYYTNVNRSFSAQVQINDTTTIMTHVQEPKDVATTERRPASGFCVVNLNQASYDIDLDYRTNDNSDESGIVNTHLVLKKLD